MNSGACLANICMSQMRDPKKRSKKRAIEIFSMMLDDFRFELGSVSSADSSSGASTSLLGSFSTMVEVLMASSGRSLDWTSDPSFSVVFTGDSGVDPSPRSQKSLLEAEGVVFCGGLILA